MSQTGVCGLVSDYLGKDEKTFRLLFDKKPEDGLFFDDRMVQKKKFMRLPALFDDQFSKLKYKSFMGLFPKINRAWVTFDNRFYIWNYLDGSDFNEYDDLDQVISAIALTVPRKKIFKSYVKYILVIASSIQVVLVAVTYRENELNLLPTNYCCSSDDTLILKICCTNNGRIFCAGKNGYLYELEYSLQGGFFKSKIQLINLTKSFFSTINPFGFLGSKNEALVDLTIDKSNHILYTLSSDSETRVFDLGASGDTFSSIGSEKVESILEDVRPQMCRDTVQMLEVEQSENVHVAMITRDGDRVYFDTCQSVGNRPNDFCFKDTNSLGEAEGKKILQNVSNAFYQKGVWVVGCSDDLSDDLYFIATESRIDLNRVNFCETVETLSRVRVEGKVLAISEIPGPVKLLEKGSELQLQHRSNNREFVCLTSKGIHIITKKQPVELFMDLLNAPHFPTNQVNHFFQKYGSDESCVMCLIIICQGIHRGGGRTNVGGRNQIPLELNALHQFKRINNPRIIRNADLAFFHHGGFAHFENTESERKQSISHHQKRNESKPNVLFSSIHNSIVMYFGRIIQPIWDRKIMHYKEENGLIKIYGVKPKLILLDEINQMLHGLRRFLEKKKHLYQIPEPKVIGLHEKRSKLRRMIDEEDEEEGEDDDARRSESYTREDAERDEKKSINQLHLLVIRSIECLCFLQLLSRVELSDLFNVEVEFRWDSEKFKSLVDKLAKLNFREFLNESKESTILNDIIKLIIHQRQCNLEELFLTLGRNCPSLFTSRDICDFQAFQLIQQARVQANTIEGRKMLKSALAAYLKIVGSLDNVPTVCYQFIRLKYFDGAVILALKGAEKIDPTGLAEVYRKSVEVFGGSIGSELFFKRIECYKVVSRVLDKLEEVSFKVDMDYKQQRTFILKILKESKDQLFHEYLYQFYISKMEVAKNERDKAKEDYYRQFLLENFKSCGFLETFLLRKKHFYLLGSYYYHCGKYLEAADILDKLASDPTTSNIQLDIRISYLEKALVNAELANKNMNRNVTRIRDMTEMVKTLKSKIEVANLQKEILKELIENVLRPIRQNIHQMDQLVIQPSNYRRNYQSPQQYLESLELLTRRLAYELVDITFLYNKVSVPYDLHDCSLKTLHLSNYEDKILIRDLWKKILNKLNTKQDISEKITEIRTSIFGKSVKIKSCSVFPLDYIIACLERKTVDIRDPYYVVGLLGANHISITDVYQAYRKIFEHLYLFGKDPLISDDSYLVSLFSKKEFGRLHVFRVCCRLLLDIKNKLKEDADLGSTLDENFPSYVLSKHLEQYFTVLRQVSQGDRTGIVGEIKNILLELKS